MNILTHVYYDQVENQIVLFEANLTPKYKFIFEKEEKEIHRQDFDQIENRELWVYLGVLDDEKLN